MRGETARKIPHDILRAQAIQRIEQTVGWIIAPLFFTTTIRFPTTAGVSNFVPKLPHRDEGPESTLGNGVIEVPTGGTASVIIGDRRVFVADLIPAENLVHGVAVVEWRKTNLKGRKVGHKSKDYRQVVTDKTIIINNVIEVTHTQDV